MNDFTPPNWKQVRIRDVSELKYGKSPVGVKSDNGKFDLIGTSGIVGKSTKYLCDEPSVLLGRKGTINRPIYTENPFWAIDTAYYTTAKSCVSIKWLFYNFCHLGLEKYNEASGVPSLGRETLNAVPTLLPPLPEQKKIAAILTSVDDVIENTQAQIAKLQDLKTATMNELMTKGIGHTEFKDSELGRIPTTWKTVTTSEIYNFKNGLNKEKSAFGSGQRIVNYMDVFRNERFDDSDLDGKVQISDSEHDRFEVKSGDLFFTRTSETPDEIGMSASIILCDTPTCFSGFILRARPMTKAVLPEIAGYLYRCSYVRTQIVKLCSYTTRALTNGTSLGRVIIALPTIQEQKLIASTIQNIELNISCQQSRLSQFQSLKKALMNDLLTGKVRVNVN